MEPIQSRLTKKNLEAIALLDKQSLNSRSWDDRLIDEASKYLGSKWFVYLNALLAAWWLFLNAGKLRFVAPFDPYPFSLLAVLLSIETLFLSMLILISQSRQNALAERRAHLELQLILLAEQENTVQIDLLLKIARSLELEVPSLPTEMLKETEPSVLVGHLEEVFDQHDLDIPGARLA